MQESNFVKKLFGSIATKYDLANHLLSVGMDFWWRCRAAKTVKKWDPTYILDLATGSGDLAITLKKYCAESIIVGADFCYPMLLRAQSKGIENLVLGDGLRLPFADGTFDVVTVAFGLRNMESWSLALREINRITKSNGHILILEFSIPNPPLRGPYRFYLHRCLPAVASWLTHEKSAYDYLGNSIEQFPHGAQMKTLMMENGFCHPTCETLSGGIVSLYTGSANKSTPQI